MANEQQSTPYVDRGTPMLTTYDNPWDPFTEFTQWYDFDSMHGYNCAAYIDRVANTSTLFTDSENNFLIEKAIDDLIKDDFLHIYRKVFYGDKIEVQLLKDD